MPLNEYDYSQESQPLGVTSNQSGTWTPAQPAAPQTPNGFIDPGQAFQGSQGASKLLGQLNRAQWEDWKARFAPQITALAAEATDPNAAMNAANQAKDAVGLAFDTAQTVSDQNRESYGLSLTPAQQQARDRAANVNRSAATISAGNEARISALDRQQAILAGGMGLSNIPDRVMNQ